MLRAKPNYEAVGEVGKFWGLESIGNFEANPLDNENKRSLPSQHWQGDASIESTRRKRRPAFHRRRRNSESDQYQERPARTTEPQSKRKKLTIIFCSQGTPFSEVQTKSSRTQCFPQKGSQDWSGELSQRGSLPPAAQDEMERDTKKRHSVLASQGSHYGSSPERFSAQDTVKLNCARRKDGLRLKSSEDRRGRTSMSEEDCKKRPNSN